MAVAMDEYVVWRPKDSFGNEYEGPTDTEAGLRICNCGYAADWDAFEEHRATRDHVLRLIQGFQVNGWQYFIEEIDNGLGWARNEDMSLGLVDHDDVLAVIRELVQSAVRR